MVLFSIVVAGCQGAGQQGSDQPSVSKTVPMPSVAKDKKFYIIKDGAEKAVFLKGVNMGATKPGYFPGELAITKQEYLRWFQQIYDMGANTIRVYTTQNPGFYDALYEFNLGKQDPLYFMQGVWVNEDTMSSLMDPYAVDKKLLNDFIADAKNIADVIHGKITLPPKPGFASGAYTKDVSNYMIGWIMGIEWAPAFVANTNTKNAGMSDFTGTYIKTVGASPFEIFLATAGEGLIAYELEKYAVQRPLSFTNWVTTDTITHTNEPLHDEDYVSVDTEKIKATAVFKAGLFASYHVYPYYPDMFSFQAEYVNYIDPAGKKNPYRAYLKDLISRHTMPVMVAEFGIPAARGKAHENAVTGYNQGFTDEITQGKQLVSMLDDIHQEGYIGGLIFSWQDEWFKRTWNTMNFDNPDMRPYWSNAQTCEQQFGLLAFDPGVAPIVILDGQGSEWPQTSKIGTQGTRDLYMLTDEKYVYFMVRDTQQSLEGQRIIIPVNVTTASGSSTYETYRFDAPADFIININGAASKMLVHSYYDSYYYLYGEKLGLIEKHPEYAVKDNSFFNSMMLPVSKSLYLPVDQRQIPFTAYETGLLTNGIADPVSSSYNSLADWFVMGTTLEIRIPWQLLNFRAPSIGQIMDDFYTRSGFYSTQITSIQAGVNSTLAGETIALKDFTLKKWDMPTYHERLKQSYYTVKAKFLSLN
ncbi:MAG TPA: family 2 glycosyl transferase [Desulfuromonadales bacterium]|nr:family 2 glycosyl transferase [Desulfuromonadales bacterium]